METVEPEATKYELTLEGGGITLKREVDEPVALRILATVMGGGAATTALRPSGGPADAAVTPTKTPGRGTSLREYLDETEAKRNIDKILAIACWLETERGIDTFKSADIRAEFRSASEPVPGNFGRDFTWAVQAGWIARVQGKSQTYYVTQKGHDAVAAKFSAEVKKATTRGRTGRRRRTQKKKASE